MNELNEQMLKQSLENQNAILEMVQAILDVTEDESLKPLCLKVEQCKTDTEQLLNMKEVYEERESRFRNWKYGKAENV